MLTGPLQPHIAALQTTQGLYIPEKHYQFSRQELIQKNETLTHTFTLYNGQAQPLRVEASADCGCTGLTWQEATIPPFGKKDIAASMNAKNPDSAVTLTFKLGEGKYVFASLKN